MTSLDCTGTATAMYGVPYTSYQGLKDLPQGCSNSVSLSRDRFGMKMLATIAYETAVRCSCLFSATIQLPFDRAFGEPDFGGIDIH
jgi:hypothetical protein